MKRKYLQRILACALAAGLIGACTYVPAAADSRAGNDAAIQDGGTTEAQKQSQFYYKNEDPDEIRNAKITEEEAKAAREERLIPEVELGYEPGTILISYDRIQAAATAQQMGLDSEWELYKKDLRDMGDQSIDELIRGDESIIFSVCLNENKTVKTAVEQYEQLTGIEGAQPNYLCSYEPEPMPNPAPPTEEQPVPVEKPFRLDGIYPIYEDDSIVLGCVHENANPNTKFRWEYCKVGESEWHLISEWNTSEWCTWYPDANEDYVVICRASYYGFADVTDEQTMWCVSRPQMTKQITGRCAMPTDDGVLIGCTSNVNADDIDYWTTCYIWSCEQQSWIVQADYVQSDCAWYKVSDLPKGMYIVYNCTERRDLQNNFYRRKLSCDYYPMQIQ